MRQLNLIVIAFLCILFFNSCSIFFEAYIRNASSETATIDVSLLNTKWMKTLPNKVKVANRLLDFKCGYKKYIDNSQNVEWIGVNHFQLKVNPNTTVDLADMAGRFVNGSPGYAVKVIVMGKNNNDTLINGGRADFHEEKFTFTSRFFSKPILYYDIKQ